MKATSLFFSLLTLVLLAVPPVFAEPPLTGTWTADVKKDALELFLRTSSEKPRTTQQLNMTVPLTSVKGLSTADGSATPFRLEREAGVFSFEGRFSDAKGAGHLRFTPNEEYVRAMAALGYPAIAPDKHYLLAVFDITPARVKELSALGFKDIALDELIQVGIFQVTPGYIQSLAQHGYTKLTLAKLIQSRIHGVTPERIRALAAEGYKALDLEELLAMSIHGVTPEFIREMREAGYTKLTPEELVKLRIHGIDAKFVRALSDGRDTREKE
jgi:hypothetical protein